jgi:hypothetical protein
MILSSMILSTSSRFTPHGRLGKSMRVVDSGYGGQLGEKRATRGRGQHSVILKNVGVNPRGSRDQRRVSRGLLSSGLLASNFWHLISDIWSLQSVLCPPTSDLWFLTSDLLFPIFYLLALRAPPYLLTSISYLLKVAPCPVEFSGYSSRGATFPRGTAPRW